MRLAERGALEAKVTLSITGRRHRSRPLVNFLLLQDESGDFAAGAATTATTALRRRAIRPCSGSESLVVLPFLGLDFD